MVQIALAQSHFLLHLFARYISVPPIVGEAVLADGGRRLVYLPIRNEIWYFDVVCDNLC